jgi:hypothetical protein
MKVFAVTGTSDVATVYMAEMSGRMIELVKPCSRRIAMSVGF